MGKEKASAGLFDQLSKAVESGEGDEIVGKLKVMIVPQIFRCCNVNSQRDGCQRQSKAVGEVPLGLWDSGGLTACLNPMPHPGSSCLCDRQAVLEQSCGSLAAPAADGTQHGCFAGSCGV